MCHCLLNRNAAPGATVTGKRASPDGTLPAARRAVDGEFWPHERLGPRLCRPHQTPQPDAQSPEPRAAELTAQSVGLWPTREPPSGSQLFTAGSGVLACEWKRLQDGGTLRPRAVLHPLACRVTT